MKITPTPGYVLVKPLKQQEATQSGIILPQKEKYPNKGEVVAIGAYIKNGLELPIPYSVGNVIIFKKWEGLEIRPEGLTGPLYYIVKHQDVIAVEEEQDD